MSTVECWSTQQVHSEFKHPLCLHLNKDDSAKTSRDATINTPQHGTASLTQHQYLLFPHFLVDDMDGLNLSFAEIFHDEFRKCVKMLPSFEIPSGLDMYPVPQNLIDKMDSYFTPQPLPVDAIVDSMSEISLSESMVSLADASDVCSFAHRIAEKHVTFDLPLDLESNMHSKYCHQGSSVPFKKRPLLTLLDDNFHDTKGVHEMAAMNPDPTNNQSTSKAPVGKSLNEMLLYRISKQQKKLKSKCAVIMSSTPELESNQINAELKSDQPQNVHQPKMSTTVDDWDFDSDTLRQQNESMDIIEDMFSPSSQVKRQNSNNSSIPLAPKIFYHVFSSTTVQRELHQFIVSYIPPPAPALSPRILKYNKWVDHRTFGLSMQIYGSISLTLSI